MEFGKFIKLLKKHKYTLMLVPVFAAALTYYLVRNQASKYASKAKLATGIVDQTQKVLNDGGADEQESKISQEFSNLIEMLRSKKVLDQVSYKLVLHDLKAKNPYVKPSPLFKQLNAKARQHAIQVFTDLYNRREALSLYNPDQNGLNKLLISLHYDDQSLLNNFTIFRVQNSDYIEVQLESESAELSADAVNTLCNEFINYYTYLVKDNQRKAVDFWTALLHAKEDTLNRRSASLKAYKIRNHILNLNEKAKSIYGQISDFETRKEEVQKSIESTQAAIQNIDKQFDPTERKYFESSKMVISQQILTNRAQLEKVNEAYVQSNFDPKYKARVDSLTAIVSSQIEKLSDKYVLNPLSSKQNLVDQKLSLQVQNQLARNSAKTIDQELLRLHDEFDSLVPHEGTIQALESAVSVASQEYLEVLQKYNQTNMVSKFSVQLRIIEVGEPGIAQASKKMMMVIVGGLVSFVFCIIVFFIIFFFDSTIKSSRELANRTKIAVLGHVNQLSGGSVDVPTLWGPGSLSKEHLEFKKLIHSLRFEIDNELLNNKTLLVNSVKSSEGKTFISINLAYAYLGINKRVLVIDGNFDDNGLTRFSATNLYLEDLLDGIIEPEALINGSNIVFLGNRGSGRTLLELSGEQHVATILASIKALFDIVIIETSSLDTLNRSKEWSAFADKVLTVFQAGHVIDILYQDNMEYLKSLNGKFIGWVLNSVPTEVPVKKQKIKTEKK